MKNTYKDVYNTKTSSEEFDVFFNATDKDYYFTDVTVDGSIVGLGVDNSKVNLGKRGKVVTISETDGSCSIATEASIVYSVPARGFVILKK